MSRRPKKNPNQSPYPGSGWHSTNPASVRNDWNNLGESFWGGNNPYSRQNRPGNEQWPPGNRGRNKPSGSVMSSSSTQEKYQWSTSRVKPSENSKEASATAGISNKTTSSTSNNGDQSSDKNAYDKNTTFKESKQIIREQNRQLMMGMSKPVECSIAERMMQKMGWQGGGLGVKEEGRTEPVEVNLNFINKTTGLGHNDKKPKVQKFANQSKLLPILPVLYLTPVKLDFINQKQPKPIEKNKKKEKKQVPPAIGKIDKKKAKKKHYETIDIDILDSILDFVMDVKQIEFRFDVKYSKKERRIIHNFVEYLREGFNEEVLFDFDESQSNKIDEINEYNNYVLMSESQGAHPNRQLCLYKEAPDEVYLVTRDDLIEAQDESTKETIVDSDENSSEINKADTINVNTTENINKKPDLIKDINPEVFKADLNVDLKETQIKTANNTIIAHDILMGIVENIPYSNDSQTNDDKNLNKSDIDVLKDNKIKNKATVAVFIETSCKKLENDVKTVIIDTNETNISENNLKTIENEMAQENIEKIKDISDNINEEIIEIDLTDSEDKPGNDLNASQENPKIPSNLETSEIQDEIKENNTESDIGNEMDVELEKLRGLPKLQYLESALYIYLKDFLKHDVYTEMRFLGDFGDEDDEEMTLFSHILDNICEASARTKSYDDVCETVEIYKELYDNDTYCLQIGKDLNGGDVIYKILRNDEG